nr:dihydroxyacetone kinase subunit L [Actinomycetales bacterium]
MGASLGAEWARTWLRLAAAEISRRRIDLIELDRAIGDGDHGENMDRGFTAILEREDPELPTAADVLRSAATTLISTVGGAAGPLYGTALLRAAKATQGEEVLGPDHVVALLAAALRGIQDRGKAEEGEKTMVDAWAPALAAAREAAGTGADAVGVLRVAAAAAAA